MVPHLRIHYRQRTVTTGHTACAPGFAAAPSGGTGAEEQAGELRHEGDGAYANANRVAEVGAHGRVGPGASSRVWTERQTRPSHSACSPADDCGAGAERRGSS